MTKSRQLLAAAISETQFLAAVMDLFRWHGWLVHHHFDARRSEPGVPDLLLVHARRGVRFAELKTETGRLTREQRVWIEALRAAGAAVFVWRPSDMADIEHVARFGAVLGETLASRRRPL